MLVTQYAENPTKTIVRQAADYEALGLDPKIEVIVPFTVDDTRESIEAKGVSWAGLMRQMNQVFKENVGNTFGSKARAAFGKEETPPGQVDMDQIVANYDFSGARVSSESGMSNEEKAFRSELRTRLKDFLRIGFFSADWNTKTNEGTKITVQTQKEASEDKLPEGKIAIDSLETLLEAASEGAVFEYEDRAYDFSGDPEFTYDENDNIDSYNNLAAVAEHCHMLAEAKLRAEREAKAVKASIPLV